MLHLMQAGLHAANQDQSEFLRDGQRLGVGFEVAVVGDSDDVVAIRPRFAHALGGRQLAVGMQRVNMKVPAQHRIALRPVENLWKHGRCAHQGRRVARSGDARNRQDKPGEGQQGDGGDELLHGFSIQRAKHTIRIVWPATPPDAVTGIVPHHPPEPRTFCEPAGHMASVAPQRQDPVPTAGNRPSWGVSIAYG